jgi:hypothetical protein
MSTTPPIRPSSRDRQSRHPAAATAPDYEVEVTIKVFGWEPGASEVTITLPERSRFGAALAAAPAADAARLYDRLGAKVSAELRDAFASLGRATRQAV